MQCKAIISLWGGGLRSYKYGEANCGKITVEPKITERESQGIRCILQRSLSPSDAQSENFLSVFDNRNLNERESAQ